MKRNIMATKRWYTLYTKPNAEYQVANALQQRGVRTYLPEIELAKPQKGRKKKPFFPCYLFIKVDFESIGLGAVQWTPGLRRIVAFGDQPTPLPDDMIYLIRRRLGEIEAAGGWPAHPFRPGDTVRITEGPLRNMVAIFEGPTTPSQRVKVLCSARPKPPKPSAYDERGVGAGVFAAEQNSLTRPRWWLTKTLY
jgi:transcriptional antiterminator RfaH